MGELFHELWKLAQMAIYRPQFTGIEKASSLCATACFKAKKPTCLKEN